MGKSHQLNESDATLKESYLSHKVKHICSLVKHGLHKPTICPDCNIYIERIDNHLSHLHQVRKGTAEIRKKIKNAKKFTRQYEINFLNIDEDLEEDKSDEEESDENENEEERNNTKHTKKQKPVKKDKKHKQISQHSSDSQSTISSPKPKFKKMPRSTAKHTHLRGVYVPVSPSKYKNMSLLKYRKPLTSHLKKKMKIDSFQFKHHYTSGNELLLDFERYIKKYISKSAKSASQCASDVRSIWMAVDPDLSIHPNAFIDNELVESRFSIPQRNLLVENKDKEPHEQSPHIQAPTIKSKLISLNRFIDFIEERLLYIGLTPEQLKNLRYTSNSCKKNLKKLCEERTQLIKSFKKSVLISVSKFQQYGCSIHVILVCQKFKEIVDDPDTFSTFQDAIDMRNYLMVTICIVNCLRASNLMNMTIYDFQQAKSDAEIKGAYRFYNNKYKTSLVYGEKVILVSESLYDQIKTFITYVRPILTDDKFRSAKLRYIFTSSVNDEKRGELMSQTNHSLVSKCLT